jgi:ubiquinone/menaquinone biosynthesis C-methylase UbiE
MHRKGQENDGESDVSSAQHVPLDLTSTFDYKKLVEEEIEKYSNIEVTKDLLEGGIHAQKAWGYWFQYLTQQVWKTSFADEGILFCKSITNPRILSLGCGHGGLELQIAQLLNKPYEIVAVDINQNIFAKAEEETRAKGFNIRFQSLDLNFVEIRENSFDLILAHASLHHLLNLEHVLNQIYKGLKRKGRLIVQDIIGKTQVLFWKENLDFAIDVVRKMPYRYKTGTFNQRAKLLIKLYLRQVFLSLYKPCIFNRLARLFPYSIQKGMEGIRQEEIEQQINKYFTPVKMFKFGSFIRIICTHPELGKRFDPGKDADREYLETLFQLDLQQIEEKKLRPTEMLAVYEKRE